MKVKFKYGIKSYSGLLDEMVFCNYKARDVVIGREYNPSQRITTNNTKMGQCMVNIVMIYNATTEAYKAQLTEYAQKMFMLPEYQGKLAGNKMTVFLKMMWAWANTQAGAETLLNLSLDDFSLGAYEDLVNIKVAVDNGYLPAVDGYEDYLEIWNE